MPSRVSKLLPAVVMFMLPFAGAVHFHQTEAPPASPAWFGSPDSFVAKAVVPVAWAELPFSVIVLAFANASLDGALDPPGLPYSACAPAMSSVFRLSTSLSALFMIATTDCGGLAWS